MTPAEARASFPVLERLAYLNAGSFGPLSRETMAAVAAEQARDLQEGRSGRAYFERALALREELRSAIASLLSVEQAQVALTASTTDGCNIVLAGLGLAADDEVVTTTDEHFGLLGPVHASGARVVVVPPEPEAILGAITPRTRLIAVSHVLWTTGRVLPVHELCERAGVPVLVDGAQTAGALRVDARGLDFYAISGQKWLCGPEATGALVVSDPERLRIARPGHLSQARYDPDGSFVAREGARRFEPNWIPVASLAGLAAALRQAPAWRFEHAAETAEHLRELLRARADVVEPADRATLVSFRPAGGLDAATVVDRLAEADVVVRAIPGRELVRASVGWWTDETDLERLLAALPA